MAAGIHLITQDDQPITESDRVLLEHILTDVHDALRLLTKLGNLTAKHDAMLEEYRPLLERFAHPLAARLNDRKARRG
jgi:hypothetical protein